MSRVPEDQRPTIAQRLIQTRSDAGFTNVKDLLAAVKAAEGSAPSYSSYAQWESGSVTPRKSSLAPIWRYHEAREAAAKAREPVTEVVQPPADPLVDLLTRIVKVQENQTKAMAAQALAIKNLTLAVVALAHSQEGASDPHSARLLELSRRAIGFDPSRIDEADQGHQPSAGDTRGQLG